MSERQLRTIKSSYPHPQKSNVSDLMLLVRKSGIAELSHSGSLRSVLPENGPAHLSGRPCLEWGHFPAGGGAPHSDTKCLGDWFSPDS